MISQEYLQLLSNLTPKFGTPKSIHDEWLKLIFVWNDDQTSKVEKSLITLAEICLGLLVQKYDRSEYGIIQDMIKLHENKNAGYSGNNIDSWANFRVCESFGISSVVGCMTRLCDKYSRYSNLSEDPTLDKVNEKIEDTIMDMLSYSLILVCLLNE